MKRILWLFIPSFFFFSFAQAQQWTGNNNATDPIYRSGNVRIGGTGTGSPAEKLEIQSGNLKFKTADRGLAFYGANEKIIGTVDYGISFDLNGATRLRLNNNGNIGIGTTNPATLLEIQNTTALGSSAGNSLLLMRVAASSTSTNYFMNNHWLRRDANGSGWTTTRLHDGISIDGSYLTPGTNTRTWWERDPNNDIQSWGNDNDTYLTINTGNVGIGTDNPSQKLEIAGGNLELGDASGSTAGNIYLGGQTESGEDGMRLQGNSNAAGISYIDVKANSNSKGLVFRVNTSDGDSERMRIRADGKVGIGTSFGTSPSDFSDYNLFVTKGVRTEKVKVDVAAGIWADFVFEPEYKLLPLNELETYIKTHKHLPGIPSAQEMEKKGNNLGETDALLLQKIEELSLYLIELKKENENLKKRVEALEKMK